MLDFYIPHGGSGPGGMSAWVKWGTKCLIAGDLAQSVGPRPCADPKLLIGTCFHGYMQLWRQNLIADDERVNFLDNVCGYPPSGEVQDEAYRLFLAYTESQEKEKWGPVLETEAFLSGPHVEKALGVSPFAATIDLLAGTHNNCTLVDYKTARASGASRYTQGDGRLQWTAYYMAAIAAGYNVTRVVIEQVTKTKTPKVNTYEMVLPSVAEQKALQAFLRGAKLRREHGLRTVWLTSCDACSFRSGGLCLPGSVEHDC